MNRLFSVLLMIAVALALSIAQDSDRSSAQKAKKTCYSAAARVNAERTAKVYMTPDADYDPVLGYDRSAGPRKGSPPVDDKGRGLPVNCMAAPKDNKVAGTLPKFYCSVDGNTDEGGKAVVYKVKPQFKGQSRDKRDGEISGEFLASRFSKAMGFFADDEWVADVTCPDCEKSLTKPFQGTKFTPFQPAAGIEMSIGDGIDVACSGDDNAELATTLGTLDEASVAAGRDASAEIDAFKLWLAFIDHGDTKKQNHKLSCLASHDNDDGTRVCDQPIFYVSDMGSTFGFSSASEKKARLDLWRKKEPIRIDGGRCNSTAKSIGDSHVSEAGRSLLAGNLQRLLDAEARDGLITRVFAASRNDERDQPAAAWTAEFVRKAKTIIDARCRE
jgi:hypothetical protein